jgi:hypothetical protein
LPHFVIKYDKLRSGFAFTFNLRRFTQDMLTALEQRVVLVASDIESKDVSQILSAFALLGREPGAAVRRCRLTLAHLNPKY